jgi:hypothetical protein
MKMKKFISILLSALLVFACMIPAFATETEAESNEAVVYDGAPVVVVRGFDFMGLKLEDGSPALTFTFGNISYRTRFKLSASSAIFYFHNIFLS